MGKFELIKIIEQGDIICDNKPCEYTEKVDVCKYPQYINKPCPKCGANLLTYTDFVAFQKMTKLVRKINWCFGWLGIFYKGNDKDGQYVSVHHHEGETTITTKEMEE